MNRFVIALGLVFFAFGSSGQTSVLLLSPGLQLPKDSAVRAGLLGSLRGWLEQRGKPDSLNGNVSRAELPETSVFMDELRSIDWSNRRDSVSSCRCYLGRSRPGMRIILLL